MIVAMQLSGPTRDLANHCVLAEVTERCCTLELSPNYSLISPRVKENLQAALQTYYGRPLSVVFNTSKISANDTPAAQQQQQRDDRQQTAVSSIQNDPQVNALKEHFNARILPNTIEALSR
jgi:DNA polymerase-3 subunit gamma/tau